MLFSRYFSSINTVTLSPGIQRPREKGTDSRLRDRRAPEMISGLLSRPRSKTGVVCFLLCGRFSDQACGIIVDPMKDHRIISRPFRPPVSDDSARLAPLRSRVGHTHEGNSTATSADELFKKNFHAVRAPPAYFSYRAIPFFNDVMCVSLHSSSPSFFFSLFLFSLSRAHEIFRG